jgi:hypothetical protein
MNMNFANLESVVAFRRGANASGVRADLRIDEIPAEIVSLIKSKKAKNSK